MAELDTLQTFVNAGYGPKGPSTNPYNLQNNCVFATMAWLMNMKLDIFLNHIETMQPAKNENGISIRNVFQMLNNTKRTYAWVKLYDQGKDGGADNEDRVRLLNNLERSEDAAAFCAKWCKQWGVTRLGVCYSHASGGHCVAFEISPNNQPGGFFRDLQKGDNNAPKPSDLKLIFMIKPYN